MMDTGFECLYYGFVVLSSLAFDLCLDLVAN